MPISTYTVQKKVWVRVNRAKTKFGDKYKVHFKGKEQLLTNSYFMIEVGKDRSEKDIFEMFDKGEIESVEMN